MAVGERAPETVLDHVIDHFAVAHAITVARLREQVRRGRHPLHPPGEHDVRITQNDRLRRKSNGLKTRPADLVDRGRRNGIWNARRNSSLPRRVHTQPGGQHVAHDHLIHLVRLHPRALQCLAQRDGPEFGRRRVHK